MRAEAKAQFLLFLRESQLPSRFRRRLLQEWAEKVGATVTGEDYQEVVWKGTQ